METLGSKLPDDAVLPLNEQQELFIEAYEKFNPIDINPGTTPIPGLEPMIRMHYSYVAGLVKDSPEHLKLLERFWGQAAEIIESKRLTLSRMRSITMQLALLLTDMQKGKLSESRKDEHHCILYQKDLWKDLNNYDDKDFYIPSRQHFPPHPFYCEAILCCKTGGFSYKRFNDNYLERPFVMHLAALPLRNEGPHGGLVAESADYLQHDFGHNEILALYSEFNQRELSENSQTKDLVYWDTFRSLLKTVRDAKLNPELNEGALHIMLHEVVPSLISDNYILLKDSEEEALLISQRKLFLGAVINSASFTKVRNVNNRVLMDIAIHKLTELEGKRPWCSSNIHTSAIFESISRNEEKTYTGTLILRKIQVHKSDEVYNMCQPVDVGTFFIDYSISPIEDPLKEKVSVLKAYNLQWVETAQSHVSIEEQETIANDIAEWSYSILVESHLRTYLSRDKDNEKMLRKLYKEDCQLPPIDAPLSELAPAVDAGMKRFWQEFYLTNRHLFSDNFL